MPQIDHLNAWYLLRGGALSETKRQCLLSCKHKISSLACKRTKTCFAKKKKTKYQSKTSSVTPCKDGKGLFTTVPLKPLNDQ